MKTRTLLFRIDRLVLAALALLAAPQSQAQFNLTSTNYTQNFNALGTNTTNVSAGNLSNLSTSLNGWYFLETGTTTNTTITANNGSASGGDTYNYGATGGTDRSLGGIAVNATVPTWGFWFSNSLGATITNLSISYIGETWRVSVTNRSDSIGFSYSGSATSLAGTFTNAPALDYTNTPSAVLTNGSSTGLPVQSATISNNLSVTILSGSTFFIRWSDINISGNDDGLSIDDFSLTAFIQEIIGALNWAGGSGNWDTGFSGAVTNGAALSFSGPGGIATNNLTSPLIAAMTFSNGAGSYTVAGNAFTISNGIVNNSANTQVFSNAITLGAAQTFDAASGAMTFDGVIDNATFRLTVSGSSNSTVSGIISGSGGLTKSGTGTAFLSGANNYSGGTLVSSGVLQGDTTSLQGTITNNASIVFNQATNGAYGSVLSGTGTLIKIGASTLTLSGGNSFSGALTISNGAVRLSNATGAGATAGGIAVVNGAALELTGGIAVGAEALSLNGSGISSSGALRSVSGNNSYAGAITLGSASSIASDADTFTITGGITGTGLALTIGGAGNTTISTTGINTSTGGTLTKNGAGTLTISAGGNYTGATTINTGVVRATTASALGATNTGTTVADGAALELSGGFSLNAEAMNISGAGVGNGGVIRNVSGDNTLTGFITLGANSRINSDGGSLTFNPTGTDVNVITGNFNLSLGGAGNFSFSDRIAIGTGVLTKDGAGTLTLTSGASHSGGTTLSAGTIRLGSVENNALGTGTLALNGGILSGNNTVERTLTNSVTIGANVGFGDGVATGAIVLSGPVSLGSATRTLDVSNTTTLSGIVGGAAGVGLTKVGAGTIILSGANSFDGAIQVNAGALRAANSAGLGTTGGGVTVANGAALELAGGIAVGAESLSLTGTGISSAGALRNRSGVNSFAGAISLGGATDIASDAGTLTLSGGITGAGSALTIVGDGDLVITNTGINTGASGSLAKTGTGALVIAAASDYTGTTTIGTGGEIIAAHANALGTTAAGTTVSSGGALWLTNNIAIGAESLSLAGTGITSSGALRSLAGNNTFGGAVTLTAATRINSDGGTLTLDVAAGDGIAGAFALTFGGAGSIVVSDAIATSTGSLTKDGAGTLTLSGANTYSGGTLISAGRVVGNASSLQGNITNNAALTFDQSGTGTYNGNLSGTGVLVKDNTGTLILTGVNAQNTGGTLISGGTLQIGNGGTAGSLSGNITNNASLAFNRSDDLSYAGAVSGNGSLLKTGAGTLTLSGTNTYLGGTLVSTGALAGTTASLQGNITNNAAVVFNQSTSGAYSGTMTGTGSLTKSGVGTVTLSGANDYVGGTTVEAGALAGTTGSLQGNIANNGTVIFNQSTTGAYSGTMSGGGALVKSGSGVVTVEGNNTFAGGTTVNAGALVAANNNALGSGLVTVTNGSTFAAAGVTLSNNFTIGTAGSISPGTNVLVAGWNFQSGVTGLTGSNFPSSGSYAADDGGSGQLTGVHASSSTAWSSATGNGSSTALSADRWATGDYFQFQVSSLTVSNISLTWAQTRSGTGATNFTLRYSTNGTSFSTFTNYSVSQISWNSTTTNTSSIFAYDLSAITSLDNNSTIYLRLVSEQTSATGGTGRLDDVRVNALSAGISNAATGSGTLGIDQAGSATFSGTIANNNAATLTAANGGLATFSGAITGAGSVTKTGEGTVTLSGASANTFTGTTTVSAGTLQLNKATDVAAITGNLTVNSGATLLLSSSGNVANTSAVTLSGGTITRGSGVSEIFGPLTLGLAGGTLDFGAGAIGALSFTGTYTPSALLTVQNFLPGNKLQFGSSLTSEQLNNSSLFAFSNGFTTGMEGGYFTITAIPEPSTYLAAAGLLSLMLWPSRKRLLKDAKKILGLRAPMRDRLASKRA